METHLYLHFFDNYASPNSIFYRQAHEDQIHNILKEIADQIYTCWCGLTDLLVSSP